MHAIATCTDLNAYYHRAEFPASFASDGDRAGCDDTLLPEKSANRKEIDRHALYFKFADETEAKLRARGLLAEKAEDAGAFEVRPDAGERLRNSFSEFRQSSGFVRARPDFFHRARVH